MTQTLDEQEGKRRKNNNNKRRSLPSSVLQLASGVNLLILQSTKWLTRSKKKKMSDQKKDWPSHCSIAIS
jgi:hypothetical protein